MGRSSAYRSISKQLRNMKRMTVFLKSKTNSPKLMLSILNQNSISIPPTRKLLTISRLGPVDIPPAPQSQSPTTPSFSSLILKQEILPKLRNITIELTYVEECRDMVDLNTKHVSVLSRIISKLEQFYQA